MITLTISVHPEVEEYLKMLFQEIGINQIDWGKVESDVNTYLIWLFSPYTYSDGKVNIDNVKWHQATSK